MEGGNETYPDREQYCRLQSLVRAIRPPGGAEQGKIGCLQPSKSSLILGVRECASHCIVRRSPVEIWGNRCSKSAFNLPLQYILHIPVKSIFFRVDTLRPVGHEALEVGDLDGRPSCLGHQVFALILGRPNLCVSCGWLDHWLNCSVAHTLFDSWAGSWDTAMSCRCSADPQEHGLGHTGTI